jgi:hypothetical protein
VKKAFFWTVYGLLLVAVTIGGLEVLASFYTPAWPAFELRPIVASSADMRQIKTLADAPQSIPFYNSWGLKDRERTIAPPPGIRSRSVFVGDSFLEGMFSLTPLNEDVEQDWAREGIRDREAINLGISATGPPQYYYRIKTVALKLHPDVILEMFYSGNDFVPDSLSPWSIPPLVAERPEPSLLGAVAPHLTWLIVNRLGLSEFGRGNKSIANEFDILNDIAKKPLEQRAGLLADYYKKHYYPGLDRKTLEALFSRGGADFWVPYERTDDQHEFLQGWLFANLVDWEIVHPTWPAPKDRAEAERMVDPKEIEATLSWLTGARRLAEAKGVKFLLAVAPMASVDPRYAEYWKPWPRFYAQNVRRQASRRHLLAALRAKGLQPIDLEQDLEGVPGTYRLTDGHWTALGTSIVAKRIAAELLKLN